MFNPLDHPIVFAHPLRLAQSGWLAHVPFAAYLVEILRPRSIVELGSHRGVSYCAFCQAVTWLNLDTQCYAVDTWYGDPHAGFYSSDVLNELRQHHDPLYGRFSHLIQSSFDDALPQFGDGFIDLLHIDGFHAYEDVKRDFQNWLPKVSDSGVVLFHDIQVRSHDFGVWQLWEELAPAYPSFAFLHGSGLGLIAVGDKVEPGLGTLLSSEPREAAMIRQFFEHAGRCVQLSYEGQTMGHALETQREAMEWATSLYQEEIRLNRNFLYRAAKGLARYGVLGTIPRLAQPFRRKSENGVTHGGT